MAVTMPMLYSAVAKFERKSAARIPRRRERWFVAIVGLRVSSEHEGKLDNFALDFCELSHMGS